MAVGQQDGVNGQLVFFHHIHDTVPVIAGVYDDGMLRFFIFRKVTVCAKRSNFHQSDLHFFFPFPPSAPPLPVVIRSTL